MGFSNVIKKLRQQMLLSQQEMADRLKLTKSAYNMYERGDRRPDIDTLKRISNILKLSTDFLIEDNKKAICTECLLIYDPFDNEDNERHKEIHTAFVNAAEKYGDDLTNVSDNYNKVKKALEKFKKYSLEFDTDEFSEETLIEYLDDYIYFDYIYNLWINRFYDFRAKYQTPQEFYQENYYTKIDQITRDEQYDYNVRSYIRKRYQLPELGEEYLEKGERYVVKVLGRVAAGIPIEMSEDIIGEENITQELARKGELFGLKISGKSMEPEIHDGDVVIVRQQNDVESGEIAIITINGDDATCKRLIKYADGVRLMPINPVYEPLYFSNEELQEKPVRIIGKVMETRHKYY